MTRVAVETLAVSSSRSECIVSGSRFTVSTLISSFLRVTSLRPGIGEAAWTKCFLLASAVAASVSLWAGAQRPTPHPSQHCLSRPWKGQGKAVGCTGPILTAFAAPVEEEYQGDEEEDEQDARTDGGPSYDAHR